jgi:ABC-type enterochelin transport system permease subunit
MRASIISRTSSPERDNHSRLDKKQLKTVSMAFVSQMWHAGAAVIRDSEGTQMEIFSNTKSVIAQLIDIGMSLVALAIVLSILIGGTLPFFGSVVANLTGLVNGLGSNGLVGLIVVGMIMWLFSSRMTLAVRK